MGPLSPSYAWPMDTPDTPDTPETPKSRRRRRLLLLNVASVATAPTILAVVVASWVLRDREVIAMPAAGAAEAQADTQAVTDAKRFAYGIGFDLGEKVRDGLRTDGQSADLEQIVRGFEDGLNGRQPAIPRAELTRVLRAVHNQLLSRAAAKRYETDPAFKALADKNAALSAEAMKVFAAEGGVQSIDGVLYRPVASGPSDAPPIGDQPVVATFSIYGCDARKIDERTEITLDPTSLLPAAAKVLGAMRPGDHWLIAFPPEKAFGLGGEPPEIGPNETLIVDVTVRAVAPREAGDNRNGGGR